MRVSNSFWTVGALLSGVTTSVQKAIPNADLAARDANVPPAQTIEIPGQVATIGGGTLKQPVTEVVPESTATVTQNGQAVVTTYPAQSVVTTKSIPVDPVTVPLPGTVTVVQPISKVTLCPEPTGTTRKNLKTKPGLTYGCKQGLVCNPPKPDGCNLWPGAPPPGFICNPEDCIPPPDTSNRVVWEDDKIVYFSPAWGYFHLDVEVFGLGYDIFEYSSDEQVKRAFNGDSFPIKRQTGNPNTPDVCLMQCDDALLLGQLLGSDPATCSSGGYLAAYKVCADCVEEAEQDSEVKKYINAEFQGWNSFCEGNPPTNGNSTTTSADQNNTPTTLSLTTTAGGSRSSSTFFIPTTTTSTTTSDETTTSSSSSVPSTTTSSSVTTTSSTVITTTTSTTISTESSETSVSTESTSSSASEDTTTSGTLSTSESASTSGPSDTASATESGTSDSTASATGSVPGTPGAGPSNPSGSNVPGESGAVPIDGSAPAPTFIGGPGGPGTTPGTVTLPTQPGATPGGPTTTGLPSNSGAQLTTGVTLLVSLLAFVALLA